MKKLIILLVSLILTTSMWAQEKKLIPIEPMLKEFFNPEKLESYQQSSPEKLLDLNYKVIGLCYLSNVLPANSKVAGTLESIISPGANYDPAEMFANKMVNPFIFSFNQDAEKFIVYTIADSEYMVVVYPLNRYLQGRSEYFQQYGY